MAAGCVGEDEESEAFDNCATGGMDWTEPVSYEASIRLRVVDRAARKVTTPVLKVANRVEIGGHQNSVRSRRMPHNHWPNLRRRHPVARLHADAGGQEHLQLGHAVARSSRRYGEPCRNGRVTTLTHSYRSKSAAVPRSCRRGYRDIVAHWIERKFGAKPQCASDGASPSANPIEIGGRGPEKTDRPWCLVAGTLSDIELRVASMSVDRVTATFWPPGR